MMLLVEAANVLLILVLVLVLLLVLLLEDATTMTSSTIAMTIV